MTFFLKNKVVTHVTNLYVKWRDVAREMSITEEACRKRFSRFVLKMEERHDTCE